MKVIIERIEGDVVILELAGGKQASCSRNLLPPTARDGDLLDIVITADTAGRSALEQEVRDLQEKLKNKK